jgi:hypothetical protein
VYVIRKKKSFFEERVSPVDKKVGLIKRPRVALYEMDYEREIPLKVTRRRKKRF